MMIKKQIKAVLVVLSLVMFMDIYQLSIVKAAEKVTDTGMELLIAVDNSGSMKDTGMDEVIQFVSKQMEHGKMVSTVEYLTFNAEQVDYVEPNKVSTLKYTGQTSIYAGLEEVNHWVSNKIDEEKATNIGVIVFSDLFSSRDSKGKRYKLESALQEQKKIAEWAEEWNTKVEKGKLKIRFISWESMCPGESREMKVEAMTSESQLKNGFQVVLGETEKYRIDIAEMNKWDSDLTLEQKRIQFCSCEVIKLITGIDDLEWEKETLSVRDSSYKKIELPESYQLLLQFNYEENSTETEFVFGSETKLQPQVLLKGQGTQIFLLNNIENTELPIKMNFGKAHIYYLCVPNIQFGMSLTAGINEVGKEVTLTIKPDCSESDWRWRDFLNEEYIFELIDASTNKVISRDKIKYGKAEYSFSFPQRGEMEVKVSYINSNKQKQLIGTRKRIIK